MTTTTSPTTRRTTVLGTGIRMHHVDQGDPHGEPLVLVHGYADSWFSFSRLLPLLDAGYRVHAVDLRGHGGSDRPSEGYDIDSLAADVVAFLDAAGIARAGLVGHSLGTLVARRVAEVAPHRVERLVLIGSGRAPLNEAVLGLCAEVAALDEHALPDFARDFQTSTEHADVPEDFMERVVRDSQTVPLRTWQGIARGLAAFDDDGDVSRVKAPTLLVWGAHDLFFGRAEQEWLADTIPSARLLEYAGCGHNPHWEVPDTVARDLRAFLSEG